MDEKFGSFNIGDRVVARDVRVSQDYEKRYRTIKEKGIEAVPRDEGRWERVTGRVSSKTLLETKGNKGVPNYCISIVIDGGEDSEINIASVYDMSKIEHEEN